MTEKLNDTTHQTADAATETVEDHHERVPEGAEDMEHTLRRLNAEKAKKRAENPGLYL